MKRQELLEQMLRTSDAVRAHQRVLDTIHTLETLVAIPEKTDRNESPCSVASLTLVFGPEDVHPSEAEKLFPTDNLFEKRDDLMREHDLNMINPHSASEFVSLLEAGAPGALVFRGGGYIAGQGETGHVSGVIPSWHFTGKPEETRSEREYLVVDTAPSTRGSELALERVDTDGLINLYASAHIDEDAGRFIWVFTNPESQRRW